MSINDKTISMIKDILRIAWLVVSIAFLYIVLPINKKAEANKDSIQALVVQQVRTEEKQSSLCIKVDTIAEDVRWLVRKSGGTPATGE